MEVVNDQGLSAEIGTSPGGGAPERSAGGGGPVTAVTWVFWTAKGVGIGLHKETLW